MPTLRSLGFLLGCLLMAANSLHAQSGCTIEYACNYDPLADEDDGSCIFPLPGYDCMGNCTDDYNDNGICDSEEILGCVYEDALNFNPVATADDHSCIFSCKGDFNSDGDINSTDLLSFLVAYGEGCELLGCTDPQACNFFDLAEFDDGSCIFPDPFYNCSGECVNDIDNDLVCDELEIPGCTDPLADNFNPEATDDDDSCSYTILYFPGDIGPAGGIVVYSTDGGLHGVEVSPDLGTAYWGCQGVAVGTINGSFGDGAVNTETIGIACVDPNAAANICANYSYNGFDDWYLPTLSEIAYFWDNFVNPGLLDNYPPEFANQSSCYWSSHEYNGFNGVSAAAYGSNCNGGIYQIKSTFQGLRAFREF